MDANKKRRLTVCLGSKRIPWNEIENGLSAEFRARPDATAYVAAENAVRWADVATMIGVLKGMTRKVVLPTTKPERGTCRGSRQ